jgi:acid phosphatase
LLIVTFDENAGGSVKSIPTIIVGANVRPGVYSERLNHYKLLRTIEDIYGLPALGRAKATSPLSTIWNK